MSDLLPHGSQYAPDPYEGNKQERMDISQMYADLEGHHIEGYAAAAMYAGRHNAYFKAPLISEIADGLWMGGCINGVRLPDDFDVVVSLYPWEQYQLGPNTHRYEYKAYDAEEVPDLSEAVQKALHNWNFGKKCLIHCQAGLNRSGLVAAQVLTQSHCENAEEAIALLREKRCPLVLCNRTFENWLLSEYP